MNAFGKRNGVAYGLLGLPLAFVALPLYVILPNHYAKAFGVPLATLGAILLGARLFDAFIDLNQGPQTLARMREAPLLRFFRLVLWLLWCWRWVLHCCSSRRFSR